MTFKAKRVTRQYTQNINAPADKVHELICPVREAEWLDGWDYEMIFSQSGLVEEGCVFISHQADEPDTIWLIIRRDDENRLTEFARITPGIKTARLVVSATDNGTEQSRVNISYTFTALSEDGNYFIDNFTEENFVQDMKFWEAAMNHYLKTGKALPLANADKWLNYSRD